jgi:serine/threonine-protein phosphatase 2A activator
MKMYQAEVLEKHTVVQHFYFGDILPWRRIGTGEALPTRIEVEDKDEDDSEDVNLLEFQSTKAPWVDAGDQHPVSTTVAPWSSMPTGTMPATAAPWASSTSRLAPQVATMPRRFDATSQAQGARQGMNTLASTGSAAAMSSPLGVISQPVVRPMRKQPPPQER